MRPKSLVLLLLALGCGLVASIGISQVMESRRNSGAAAPETEPVFVALKDIKYNEPLTPQVVELEQWPKSKILPGAMTKLDEIEGRRVRSLIMKGEQIVEGKLMGADERGASDEIPKGYRVVSVQADAVSTGGNLLQPGDRVDLLVYVHSNFGRGVNETGTHTILQDVKVFAVNEQWRPPEEKGAEAIPAKTVSLLVTPAQAEKVALAAEMGKIRLVMRSPDDDTPVDSTGTEVADIFGNSEKLDRENETPNTPEKAGDLSNWLNAQNPQPAQPAAPQPEQFTMQLLAGSELHKINFTKEPGEGHRWEPVDDGDISHSSTPEIPTPGSGLESPNDGATSDAT